MKKEKTGFITPDKKIIYLDYYDINEFAKEVCQNYIKKSTNNLSIFNSFKDDYIQFEPYFDFIIYKLNYSMINPLNFKNYILYKNNDSLFLKQWDSNNLNITKNQYPIKRYTKSSNRELGIKEFNVNEDIDAIILNNGLITTIDRSKGQFHQIVAEQILNQYLIKNKELYIDFLKYIKDEFYIKRTISPDDYLSNFAIKYLSFNLGHIWYSKFVSNTSFVYNEVLLNNITNDIIKQIRLNRVATFCEANIAILKNFNKKEIESYQKIIKKI